MKTNIPIVIFTYNRPAHLRKCLDSLQSAKLASESELFVFSDGPKTSKDEEKVDGVRGLIDQISGFKKVTVVKETENIGLANSIINGISRVFEVYEEVIVLEDDLVVSKDFLEFMNNALGFYKSTDKVFSISGYCAPIKLNNFLEDVFFYQRINSWGWGTWKNRWESVDWKLNDFNSFINNKDQRKKFNLGGKDLTMMLLKYKIGLIDSWAIRFNYACFKQERLNLYPRKSKIINTGVDDSGTHTKKTNKFATKTYDTPVSFIDVIEENEVVRSAYSNFLSPSLIRQLVNEFKIWSYLRKSKKG